MIRYSKISDPMISQTVLLLVLCTNILYYPNPCHSLEKKRSRCVNIPPQPGNGTLLVQGNFRYRMNCGSLKGYDLPANAPGHGGKLFCFPGKENLVFGTPIKFPDCLEMEPPKAIALDIDVDYKYSLEQGCTVVVREVSKQLWFAHNSLWEVAYRTPPCEVVLVDESPQFVQIHLHLITEHLVNQTVDYYISLYPAVREYVNKYKLFSPSSLSQPLNISYGLWTSKCYPSTHGIGTIPEVHDVINCRGCPRSYYMDMGGHCYPCPFGYFTRAAYSYVLDCMQCGGMNTWGRYRAEFLKLCYDRV